MPRLGELSLDGSLNPVAGVLPAAIGASARDWGLICPAGQGGEAAWAGRIEVLAPRDLLGLINHFRGTQVLTPPQTAGVAEARVLPGHARREGHGNRPPRGGNRRRRRPQPAADWPAGRRQVDAGGAAAGAAAGPRSAIGAGGQHDPLASPGCWMAGGW